MGDVRGIWDYIGFGVYGRGHVGITWGIYGIRVIWDM